MQNFDHQQELPDEVLRVIVGQVLLVKEVRHFVSEAVQSTWQIEFVCNARHCLLVGKKLQAPEVAHPSICSGLLLSYDYNSTILSKL